MNRYVALQKIVELGSFTKAAELLGYTQPAMSLMISSLEKELSIKLLYRSRYGVRLTLEGKQLFPAIQKTVLQYNSMLEIAKQIRGLDSGVIRIGTLSSISCHWLPPLIKKFQQQYPRIEFILHQGDNNSIPEWVRTGEADFGFVNLDVLDKVQAKFIKEGEYRAVLPLHHPLAGAQYVTLEALERDPFLVIEEGALSKPLEAFRQRGLEPNVKIRVHDDYSILSMVESGLGVSILPELVLRKTNYQVAILPIRPAVTRKIGLVMKDKNSLPIASKYFIDYLFESVDDLP
ncbi:MAG: LysR family transcriptional regulator [Phascolarctobacterium sp.]|uniref:LysR family transcriptional regulator n=1 Tax=Phascolarctobacterium sp. TaxID=2049039 RepID=UPI0026DD9BBD|nr:LysR family transcriptional regulator [Phascolarctobacterium sp.]MDO4922309.1 LysR family transcriptional regulator [Phascolarctobacterium sp.]